METKTTQPGIAEAADSYFFRRGYSVATKYSLKELRIYATNIAPPIRTHFYLYRRIRYTSSNLHTSSASSILSQSSKEWQKPEKLT